MLHPATYIEQKLDHAAFWARLIAWLRITSVLGICVAVSALLMGGAMTRQWLTSSWVTGSLFTATFLGAGIAWAIVSLYIVLKPLDRRALARAVERSHGEPFDRVSAAVHMEGTRWRAADPLQHTFYERIQAQAGAVLRRRPGARPFSMANALAWAVAFAVLALFTIWFYAHFRPLRNVQASEPSPDKNVVQPDEPDAGLEIPPEKTVEEPERPWGEVRISEPGANLRITALDSVALQIEAAASSSIKSVVWKLAKNGGPEEVRTLGPPSDPYYAVYRDEIDAVALQLADWDVVSYFAVAETNDGKTYQSDVYFLDVMPLAQELEDLPGGYEGSAYQALNELTRMLDEQEEVVRRTHRQAAASDPNLPELAAEREALGQKQAELQRDLRHLQARLNAEFPESEEPSWRKSLDAATASLERTKNALREPDLAEARDSARDAHAKLAEARNRLFDDIRKSSPTKPTKPASDDTSPTKPDSPAGTSNESPNEYAADSPAEPISSPEQWRDELDQMAARDAERKADRDFVAQMAERERNLASRIPPQNPQVGKQLSPEQQQINQAFEQFLEQNPQLTQENSQPEVAQAVADAHKALQQTHQKLNQGAPFANQDAATAAQKLDKLADAIQQADPQQKLNEAYQLKKLLEQQSRFLEQVQQTPEKFDSNQLQKSSEAIRDTTERLNSLANTPPTRDEFQQPLRDSLNDASRENIAKQCNGMCQNPGSGQSGQSAGQLKQSLDSISQAFEQSVRPPQPSQSQSGQQQSGQQQSGQQQSGQQQSGQQQSGQQQSGQQQSGQQQSGQQQSGQQQSGQQQSGQQQSGQQQSGQQQSGQQQSGQQQSGQSQGAGNQANRSRWSGEDRLRDRAHESLERGIRQVESLARDAERRGRQVTQSSDGRDNPSTDPRESGRLTADQRRQLRSEASRNLNAGIYGTYGHNDRTESVVRGIDERLADERQPIDGQIVEEMLRSIQDVRRERASAVGENASDADVSRGASTAVPPAYRAPVQKYFQKLSEQR